MADIEGIKSVVAQVVTEQARPRSTKRDRELASRTIEVTAGAGAVKVRLNGLGQVTGLTLSPEIFADRDAELLSDLLLGALAEAQRRAIELAEGWPAEIGPAA